MMTSSNEEEKENEMDAQAEVQSNASAVPGPETFRSDVPKVEASANEKKWKIVFGLLNCAIIGVIVIAIAIGVTRDDGDDGASSAMTSPSTDVPTAPTFTPLDNTQDQLNILRQGLEANTITAGYLDLVPSDAESLKGKFANQDEDVVVRAASWVVHTDPYNNADQLVARFALATIYLQTGGAGWTDSTNWLTETSICTWNGVRCGDPGNPFSHELAEKVRELDFRRNNLDGPFPDSIALLRELRILWLDDNSISGEMPGEALASLPALLMLYAQRNKFTGPIPTSLRNNGILGTLHCRCLIDQACVFWFAIDLYFASFFRCDPIFLAD
jgi:hypothetical protein